jgi:hypothetical protein
VNSYNSTWANSRARWHRDIPPLPGHFFLFTQEKFINKWCKVLSGSDKDAEQLKIARQTIQIPADKVTPQ